MYIDTGGSAEPRRLVVDPDKLVQLEQGIEAGGDRIERWLATSRRQLRKIDSPGEDPCSQDAVGIVAENGGTAFNKGEAYVARLTTIVEKMDESAKTYRLVEDDTATAFRRGPA
jgi:hypothetical protein